MMTYKTTMLAALLAATALAEIPNIFQFVTSYPPGRRAGGWAIHY